MKDAFYFSHDSNSKDDPKCALLIEQLGLEGYGIFWVLIEILRDQPNYKYPLSLIPSIARKYNSTVEKVKTVVFNYALFEIENDTFFYSNSLLERMNKYELKCSNASKAGKISAEKRKLMLCSTTVQQPFNERSTTVQPNKSNQIKSNQSKIKENKNFIPPQQKEVFDYCQERKNGIDSNKFINYYQAKGWMIGKNKMKDWKAAVRTWENTQSNNNQDQETKPLVAEKMYNYMIWDHHSRTNRTEAQYLKDCEENKGGIKLM